MLGWPEVMKPQSRVVVRDPILCLCLTVVAHLVSIVILVANKSVIETNPEAADRVLGALGPSVSIALFIAPFDSVRLAMKSKQGHNLPAQTFICQGLANVMSIAYGMKVKRQPIWGSNLFGLGCQVLWLSIHRMVSEPGQSIASYALLCSGVCTLVFYSMMVMPVNLLGSVMILTNFVLYASPLARLGKILKTRNADSLPIAISFMMFLCNFFWTLYAWVIGDILVLIPSIVGYELSVFQLLVIAWCKNALPFELYFLQCNWNPKSAIQLERIKRRPSEEEWFQPQDENEMH